MTISPSDAARVRELLGREPRGAYEIVVRTSDGDPVVLRNAPLLDDGTPMPTRYWLIGPDETRRIGRIESSGGVDRAEAEVDPATLADAHDRYAAERDAALPSDHSGPRPSGGVGGTRTGVKCLHAHWAWHLAGGDDPIGRWIERELAPSPDDQTERLGGPHHSHCATDRPGDPASHTDHTDHTDRTDGAANHAVDRAESDQTDRAGLATGATDRADGTDRTADHTEEPPDQPDRAYLSTGATDWPEWVDVVVEATTTAIRVPDGSMVALPVGASTLTDRWLRAHDPPRPEDLTNAFGDVADELDNLFRVHDALDDVAVLRCAGAPIEAIARVEVGGDELPESVPLSKADAEEIFRMLATESAHERIHNPGLGSADVETVVGACCILLAVMRRQHLDDATLLHTEA